MANEQLLPAGYRQGLITSVTVVLTATISLLALYSNRTGFR